jgi:hypothetical protein
MRTFLAITILLLLNACGKTDKELNVQSISFQSPSLPGKDTTLFEVHDNGFLTIYHTNVDFYASVDSLDVSLSSDGSTIWISEIPYYHVCPSNTYCRDTHHEYDLVYTIGPLERKTYGIVINNQPGLMVNIPCSPTKFHR